MKRIRLSTLMLLVVIAALSAALVVRDWRDAGREARLRIEAAEVIARAIAEQQKITNAYKTNNATGGQPDGAGRSGGQRAH